MSTGFGIFCKPINIAGVVEQMIPNQIAEEFMKASMPTIMALGNLPKNPPPNARNLEPISHSFVRIGNTMLLTVLFRYDEVEPKR